MTLDLRAAIPQNPQLSRAGSQRSLGSDVSAISTNPSHQEPRTGGHEHNVFQGIGEANYPTMGGAGVQNEFGKAPVKVLPTKVLRPQAPLPWSTAVFSGTDQDNEAFAKAIDEALQAPSPTPESPVSPASVILESPTPGLSPVRPTSSPTPELSPEIRTPSRPPVRPVSPALSSISKPESVSSVDEPLSVDVMSQPRVKITPGAKNAFELDVDALQIDDGSDDKGTQEARSELRAILTEAGADVQDGSSVAQMMETHVFTLANMPQSLRENQTKIAQLMMRLENQAETNSEMSKEIYGDMTLRYRTLTGPVNQVTFNGQVNPVETQWSYKETLATVALAVSYTSRTSSAPIELTDFVLPNTTGIERGYEPINVTSTPVLIQLDAEIRANLATLKALEEDARKAYFASVYNSDSDLAEDQYQFIVNPPKVERPHHQSPEWVPAAQHPSVGNVTGAEGNASVVDDPHINDASSISSLDLDNDDALSLGYSDNDSVISGNNKKYF